ncbi:MAG: YraN family protein [Proteobacteria bacterium]|nr:YraN family protein [Pseudomonadota bacterium]MDA0926868.1 YraN family protein [Pseudomonadota bacterium]
MHKRTRGWQLETQALKFLRKKGLRLLARNFNSRFGEIDLIMTDDPNLLVFVEVRFRASQKFGGATASVTRVKQHRLRLTASSWLQANHRYQNRICRFDVVAMTGPSLRQLEIIWIKNAFS